MTNDINDIEKLIAEISGLLERLKVVDFAATDLYANLRTSKPSAKAMREVHDAATRLVRMRRVEDRMSGIQYKARVMAVDYRQLMSDIAVMREDLRGFENEVKL